MSTRSSSRNSESDADADTASTAPSSYTQPEVKITKNRTWIKIVLFVLVSLVFIVAAFVGGYMFRQYYKGNLFGTNSVGNLTWREGGCIDKNLVECGIQEGSTPPLIVLSFGGFRADFLDRGKTPALSKFRTCGTHAPAMHPVYPTNSFPNQYSLVTGLFPDAHGIVDNSFRDNETAIFFDSDLYADQNSPTGNVWKGEPIWITAKKQKKRCFVNHWAGSEVAIQGFRPDNYSLYNPTTPWKSRINRILDWISLPVEKMPHLILAYFEEVDRAGHKFGTGSQELNMSLANMSDAVDALMQGLGEKRLLGCVNVIIVSDHGMDDATCLHSTDVLSVIRKNVSLGGIGEKDFDFFGGAQGRLSISKSNYWINEQIIMDALSCSTLDNLTTYYQLFRKETLPARLHYRDSSRIEPIILNAKPGYSVWKTKSNQQCQGGIHGYDPLSTKMNSIFLADGPSFKSGFQSDPFSVIEIYNLLCDLLNLHPAENQGTWGSLHHLLKNPKLFKGDGPSLGVHPGFPNDFASRSKCTERCGNISGTVTEADLRLNFTTSMYDRLMIFHAEPYGLPESQNETAILVGRDFVNGYSSHIRMVLWTSFSLTIAQNLTVRKDETMGCQRADVRLEWGQMPDCNDYQFSSYSSNEWDILQPVYLAPTGLSRNFTDASDAKLITNIVPMYPAFLNEVWIPFWNTVTTWLNPGGRSHVYAGPIFDHWSPLGQGDVLNNITFVPGSSKVRLPSHFFVILSRQNPTCSENHCQFQTIAFIFPHQKDRNQHPCQEKVEYFWRHTATVADVEKMTGLKFFSTLPLYVGIRLKTAVPVKLWK